MSKNFVLILLLTLVATVAWIAFQIFKEATKSTVKVPSQQLQELNPNLDTEILETLKKAPK